MSEPVQLPPRYYLDNFRYVLGFVERQYHELLLPEEQLFLKKFGALTDEAQCLFVRFTNRRGLYFRTEKLSYPEIGDLQGPLAELYAAGMARPLGRADGPAAGQVLEVFTKNEVLKLLPLLGMDPRGKASLKKEQLIDFLLENVDLQHFEELFEDFPAGFSQQIVRVLHEPETMLMKFLFFGNRHSDMSEFVVRDLGYLRFERFDEDRFVPLFASRREVDDRLAVSLAREDFRLMKEAATPPAEVHTWLLDWAETHLPLAEMALPAFDRLVVGVGGFLERQKAPELALETFRLTLAPPARERQVRLLMKLHDPDAALALCREMLASPYNADEQYFARDFEQQQQSRKRIRRSTTQWLQRADTLPVPLHYRYRVEEGVAEAFRKQGFQAVHAENWLWDGLFGLLFWDIIYEAGTIHHPLQRSPSDIYRASFFDKRRSALLARLDLLDDPPAAALFVEQVFQEKKGITNPMVVWFAELLPLVQVVLARLPAEPLKRLLIEMATNLREHSRGFPDLFIWNEERYELIEVKSPTDHLSSQQLYWLHFFEVVGLKARVLRVVWEKEP